MADHVEEWFERRGPAGRQAFILLNLPPPKARFLSRAVARTIGGLRNLSSRSASLAVTLRDILEPLESFVRESAHPHFAESFKPVLPSGPKGSRSNKVQGSNPWWSALVEDCARPPPSDDALHLLIGVGAATLLLETELSGITRRYAERLRWTLHDLDACTTLWTLTGRLLEEAADRPMPIAMLLERSRRIPHNPKVKAGKLWATLIQALGALTKLEEHHGNPMLLRFGAWPTAQTPESPRIRLLAETEESSAAAYIELPQGRPESIDGGDSAATTPADSATEPDKPSIAGLSPDTPAGQPVDGNAQALHIAAESWARIVDERSLLPMAWSRLSNDEIDRITARLRTPNAEWDSTAVSQVLGLIALGAHDEGNVRQRTLNLVPPPNAFVPTDARAHLYRPRVGSIILTLDDIAHPPVESRRGPITTAHELLEDLRRDRSLRALAGRIGRILPGRTLDANGELTLVNDLFQNPDAPSLGGDYYAGYGLARLAETLMNVAGIRVTSPIPLPPDAVVGSAGVPRLIHFKESVDKLRSQCAAALKDDRLPIDVSHNLYTAYTTLLLLSATLHRFFLDPFHDPRQFLHQRDMALSCDKAVSSSHLTRLSPFGATPQKQEARYRVHLKGLAQKLLARGHAIAHDILNLIGEEDGIPSPRKVLTLPYLFFLTPDLQLKRVSFDSFREVVSDWPWHQSAHRHLFSTLLREAGVPGEYVEHALGHWEASESPLGDWSVLSADDFLSPVTEAIERILHDIGLTALRGFSPHRNFPVRRRLPSPPPEPAQAPAFGSIERRNRREKVTARDTEIVKEIWNRAKATALIDDDDKSIPAIVVHEARNEILRRFAHHPERVLHKLVDLRKITTDLRDQGVEVLVPGLAYRPTDDAPPVADLTGKSLQDATRLRTRLTKWIEDNAAHLADAPFEDVRVAALTSAVIFGGLRRDLWAPFVRVLGRTYARVDNVEWLMLPTESGEIRYLGDYITRMLSSLASERAPIDPAFEPSSQAAESDPSGAGSSSPLADDSDDDESPEVDIETSINETSANEGTSPEHADERANQTITAMLALVRTFGGPPSAAALASCLSDDVATRVSGITNGWLNGRTPSTCLANVPFARLITGKRIHNPAPPTAMADDAPQRALRRTSKTTDLTVSRAFAQRVLSALRDDFKSDFVATNPPETTKAARSMRNAAVRARMLAALENLASQIPSGTAPVMVYSLKFAISITSKGGIRGRPLAPASIKKYVEPNLMSLLSAFSDVDPTILDGDERAERYIATLGPKGKLNPGRVERAQALSYFDGFLSAEFRIELAPWTEIEPAIYVKGRKVNANVMTIADLTRLSRLDAQTLGLSDSASQWLPALPRYLGAGLRTGEVWRVQPHDEATSDEIWVRSNREGSVKSASGTRRAPDFSASLGVLDPKDSERKSPRIASKSGKLEREDLADAASRACRMATGDQTILPRHARHGFASNLAMLATQSSHPLLRKPFGFIDDDSHQCASAAICQRLTGRRHKSSQLLPALSLAIGHKLTAGYDSTTHSSYTHVLDLVAAVELDQHCPELSQRAIASLRLMNHSSLRSELRREKIKAAETDTPSRTRAPDVSDGNQAHATIQHLKLLVRNDCGLDLEYLQEPGAPAMAKPHRRLELEVMITAISGLQQQQSISDVSATVGIDEDQLRDAIELLAGMPRGKGFNLCGLNGAEWGDPSRQFLIWSKGTLALSRTAIARLAADLDSIPVRTSLTEMHEAFRKHPQLRKAVQAICSCLRVGSGPGHWTTLSPIQQRQLIQGLQIAGLSLVDHSGVPLSQPIANNPSGRISSEIRVAAGHHLTATLAVTALATMAALSTLG